METPLYSLIRHFSSSTISGVAKLCFNWSCTDYLKNFLAQGTPFEVENKKKAIINMELRDRPYLALLYMCEDEQVEAVLAIESCFRWLLVPLALVTPADADIPALRLYLLSLEAAVAKPAADTLTWIQNQSIIFTQTIKS